MKPIEQLRRYIEKAHPTATLELTPPLNEEGAWFLDVTFADKRLVVEWSLATGFGVSTLSDESYGERPDEMFRSIEDVQKRVTQLLSENEITSPPLGVLLSRLRERRGKTQEELATKLGIKQATVSGMERREDVQMSTLRRVIEALGGSLEIFAVFKDARYRLASHISGGLAVSRLIQAPTRRTAATESKLHYEGVFTALQRNGELHSAEIQAEAIHERRIVIMMP